ncbi:hypothetical protein D5R81_18480 [Parashewanella spongiae]|uniref:Uncharacterized protein n=1 Tax=Parashewanella spongiae TaxID=342950 RepID=A0A3A6TEG5_9GAMM|nr:hypothetical protein [Parashewanella spongiae]MCL1080037.1 hypothetical protein [Parashewanella spongiae]RJY05834.1 hypothetical protein D5R81_18480 [Parashewanella spongiae]
MINAFSIFGSDSTSDDLLPFFGDKHPAEIYLKKDKALVYLDTIYEGEEYELTVQSRHLIEGKTDKDYFYVFQSSTMMLAIHVTDLGDVKVDFPKWSFNDHAMFTDPAEDLESFKFLSGFQP